VKSGLKRASRAAAGMLPAALLVRLGMPALAALVFLAILVLGAICWIISDPDRSDRVNRMLLARRGDARCLVPDPSASALPASRPEAQSAARRSGKRKRLLSINRGFADLPLQRSDLRKLQREPPSGHVSGMIKRLEAIYSTSRRPSSPLRQRPNAPL
jgi:hypothetical protein